MTDEPPEEESSVTVDTSEESDWSDVPWFPYLLWFVVFPGILLILLLSIYLLLTVSQ